MSDNTIYQFSVQGCDGEEISLSEFRNKVLLIVNTASVCSFTRQLRDLENLRQEFEHQDFEILAFPSNDFGRQEPFDGHAIVKFCKINFSAKFRIFGKTHVRGSQAHPLFKFLSDKARNGRIQSSPKWNFHKYLINREGEVVDYFYSFTKPCSSRVKRRINDLLIETSPVMI